MNTLIYAGVVAAGAVTLLIEAHRNFNSSLTTIPFKEHPILRNMRVEQLCTSREKTAGFLFYSLLYIVTYIVILSSAEIYDLIIQEQASGLEIGPINTIAGQEEDPGNLLKGQYGKPIFISAAIIAIFSIGALRPIENTMRSLAHRLAGVPRGVYLIIEKLHAVRFEKFVVKDPPPLTKMFRQNAKSVYENSFDRHLVQIIETSLLTVDFLSPAITGKQRIQHFPFTQLEAMGAMSDTLEQEVDRLRENLSRPLANDAARRRELFDMATGVANDTIALFSVHFLRNNRAIKNIGNGTAIAFVNNEIKRDYQVEANSFAMGLLMALIFSIGTAFALYYNWQPISPARLYEVVSQVTEAPAEESDAETCAMTFPGDAFLFDQEAMRNGQTATPAASLDPACLGAWKIAASEARAARLERSMINAIRQPLPILFAVALAALAAIFGRDVRREDNSWPVWSLRRPAFIYLITMSLVPAILAALGVASADFVLTWFEADFILTQNEVAYFFSTKWVYFAAHVIVGFVVSLGVLTLSDQHDRLNMSKSLIVGLVFGALSLAAYYLVVVVGYSDAFRRSPPDGAWVPFAVRETLIYGGLPSFFLVFYALWLEITEDKPTGATPRFCRRNSS